jgi:uncharacterized membrane protein
LQHPIYNRTIVTETKTPSKGNEWLAKQSFWMGVISGLIYLVGRVLSSPGAPASSFDGTVFYGTLAVVPLSAFGLSYGLRSRLANWHAVAGIILNVLLLGLGILLVASTLLGHTFPG